MFRLFTSSKEKSSQTENIENKINSILLSNQIPNPHYVSKAIYQLIDIRKSIRKEINMKATNFINREKREYSERGKITFHQIKELMKNYLLLQDAFSDMAQAYHNFSDEEKLSYWEKMNVQNPHQVKNDFDDLINYCNFTSISFNKALSYLFQNFQYDKGRDLLNNVVKEAISLKVKLIICHPTNKDIVDGEDLDKAIPIFRQPTLKEISNNQDNPYASFKEPLTDDEFLQIREMSLDNYLNFLHNKLIIGNPKLLTEIRIQIPKVNRFGFSAVYNELRPEELAIGLLDFAQINLHEFGHALAYLRGECINLNALPNSKDYVPLPNALENIYNNAEELRNITTCHHSENFNDIEGPQRLSHKAIIHYSIEEFTIKNAYKLFYHEGSLIDPVKLEIIAPDAPYSRLINYHRPEVDVHSAKLGYHIYSNSM